MALVGRYETAVVRLVGWTSGRPTAGLGVLVGTRQVVTCAHVVNTSLGRDQREQARPDPSAVVQVEFPLLPGAPVRTGRVQAWVPPPQRGEGEGDVAGLVLSEDAPTGATPARFAVEAAVPGSRLRVFGYPETPPRERGGWVDVDLKGDVGGQLMQVESRTDQTIKAQPGYSGSPVWQHGTGLVLGLLHAAPFADEPYRDAYLLPAILVAEAWEEQFDYLLVPKNPYRGLESFTAEQAEVFFGRDQDIDLLASRVLAQPVVVVVGPSGVGKSSLVQAGLVPRLREAGRWSVVLVRPGRDPWQRLAAGLLRAQHGIDEVVTAPESRDEVERTVERLRGEGLGPLARFLRSMDRPLLVVVDQFEELLATGQPPDPQLLDLLLPPHDAADDPSRVAITLRADYLPALLAVPGIGPRLNQRLYMLSPLTEDQLRAVVERPATACQVGFDAGLVDQIVRDAGAGSLPLLQFTLTRLWETQQRKRLSFVGYYGIGGVSGALDRFAEQQMSMLPDNAAGVVDRVLLRLVRTPAGDPGLTTRQRAYQSDLPPAEWEVARRLAVARLVIVDTDSDRGPYAELAHEALITSWRRLGRLVGDNADFLGWLAWVQQRAAEGDPLPEVRIAEARRWVETRPDAIPDQVHAFIDSSQTAVEARLHELSQARNRAEALRLAADAELALRSGQALTTVALALGAESLLTEPTAQGELALRHVLRLHPRTIARLDHGDSVLAVAFAADGTRVATGSEDGSARVFEAEPGLLLRRVIQLITRPLQPAELRRYSLPWNCRHIEEWLRRQAAVGHSDATRGLVSVLLSRRSEDDLSEAETWCRRLIDREDADMRVALGAIAARRGSHDQAVILWRQAADDGDVTAALKLAPVEAVNGHIPEALELLRAAAEAGLEEAPTYASIIDRTVTDAQLRSLETAAKSATTDALNFLGLAALTDGRTGAATDYWSRSAERGDWSALLLLSRVDKFEAR